MNAPSLPIANNALAYPQGLAMRNIHVPESKATILSMNAISMQPLFDHISKCTGLALSADEQMQIQQAVKMKTLRRRQYFLQEGDVCKYMGFIIKGAMRMYSINEKGQESIINFGLEQNWMVDQESFTMLIPSKYYIEALECTELLIISNALLQMLMNKIPALDKMMRVADNHKLITAQKRVHTAISMTAEERYQDLLCSNPDYIQRFSQNMIAAYLGIKSETLSRIRNK